jgi:hypothetical protein
VYSKTKKKRLFWKKNKYLIKIINIFC